MKKTFFLLLLLLTMTSGASELPTFFKGRVRPVDAYARLWLYDIYHQEEIKAKHQESFHATGAQDFLWQLNFLGHTKWNNAPLFWVHYAALKNLLHLNLNEDRFSYHQLHQALFDKRSTQVALATLAVTYTFIKNYLSPLNRERSEKLELPELIPGLWVKWQDNDLIVSAVPPAIPANSLWSVLEPGMKIGTDTRKELFTFEKKNRYLVEEAFRLLSHIKQFTSIISSSASDPLTNSLHLLHKQNVAPQDISVALENQHPLAARLAEAGVLFKVLPGKNREGEWYPLNALNIKVYDPLHHQLVPVSNFTLYSDSLFEEIREAYKNLELEITPSHIEQLKKLLDQGYRSLAGAPYKWATRKILVYPTENQLYAESLYYHYPLIEVSILFYTLSLLTLLIFRGFSPLLSVAFLLMGFLSHTLILALRSYILQRPPVSNMFETVIYVPWVAVLVSLCLWMWKKNGAILIASSFSAVSLLLLLRLANVNSSLENVQAVLDSQYWLTVHVLLIVASYGAFILAGLLGHFYLLLRLIEGKETSSLKTYAAALLHALYLGVLLLISGTLLGGVWAAESWGRFWDWDPKESWAFISSCFYLVAIHAYRYKIISHFGLALSAIAGLMAISFTWYGVNYILGTGLHSYGFGSGGEMYYYLYLIGETLVMSGALLVYRLQLKSQALS